MGEQLRSGGATARQDAMNLIDRDRASLWHPYTQMQMAVPPLPIVRGSGVYLFTEDGRRILDGISSWWVNIHGHSHPRLNRAIAEQAQQLEHVMFAGCTHEPAIELAERLVALLPDGLTRVFFSDNGSTAVEVAVKLACQYWSNLGHAERRVFLVLEHAYHGDTVGAMSVSAESVFTRAFAPLLFQVVRACAPYCFRCPLGLTRDRCQVDCLGHLEMQMRQHSDTIAAVIVEPMLQGAGGMIVWPTEYLAGVRRLCNRYGALMVADEVLTGFGRTGRMFACEHADVAPDIICLSKALTAGYLPMGATVVTSAIFDAFLSSDHSRTFFHGHSFTANPLACAVALASLDLFEERDVLEDVERIGSQLRQGLARLRDLPCVGDVRVIGGVGAVELGRAGTSTGYLDRAGPLLAAAFLERGLLLRPLGNVLYFMPPYVITPDEVEWSIAQIVDVLRDFSPN
jgi:adenosylmethionine---8-amino-7-oxononanoate aminotransferase